MSDRDLVMVFPTTHQTLKAEKALEEAGIGHRTIMKPRKLSSDCGLAIRVSPGDLPRIRDLFNGGLIPEAGFFTKSGSGWEMVAPWEGR